MSYTRYFVLVMGILFILAGIGGFVPLVTTSVPADAPPLSLSTSYGHLLGLFPINIAHNLIHLVLGIWGVIAYKSYASARRYCQVLAITLAVFTVLGIVPSLSTTFGLVPMYGHDIWLHAAEAVVAAYFGFVAPRRLALSAQ